MSEPTEAGRRIRHYLVRREIARGGMAIVYLASNESLGRNVALKACAPELLDDPVFVERFRDEARIVASLNHPNIVTVHDYFIEDGVAYLVMEYFTLGTVRPLVGKLETPQVLTVLFDVLAGLGAAEELGVVHRDLKPENLFRTHQGAVKVGDFGIALAPGLDRRTRPGEFQGALLYVAPEVLVGRPATSASDLYAVGVIAYELFTGVPPFADAPTVRMALERKSAQAARSLAGARGDLPFGLVQWVDRLLSREPEGRFVDALAAAAALEEAQRAANLGRAPLPINEPSDRSPEAESVEDSSFGSLRRLASIAPLSWRLRRAVFRPTTVLVVAATVAAATLMGPAWWLWGGVAVLAMILLSLVDEADARAARTSGRGASRPPRGGKHARAQGAPS